MKFSEMIKPTISKIILTIILTIILLFLSQAFATIGGEMVENGFPLHYQSITFSLPCYPPPCTTSGGYTQIAYANLIIDIIFWLVISYLLVSAAAFTLKKKK